MRLRVSGKVIAEDLDVLVNTLILCKLLHKRLHVVPHFGGRQTPRTLISLLIQIVFVFRTCRDGWGLYSEPPWQTTLGVTEPTAGFTAPCLESGHRRLLTSLLLQSSRADWSIFICRFICHLIIPGKKDTYTACQVPLLALEEELSKYSSLLNG